MLTAVAAALSGGAQPVLPGFLNSLAGPLEHYGVWAILALVLIEDFGIPVPGETVLIAGAVFAGSGQLNVVAVGVIGFAAAVLGDNIGYAIGRYGGRALVERWGRYIFLTAERLDRAEAFFDRQGGKIVTIARFIEGLRQANGIIAGVAEMRWRRFLAFNALGAALWVGTWVSAGYFAGQHITTIYNNVTKYSLYAAIVAVVVIAAWIAYRLCKRRRHRTGHAKPESKVTTLWIKTHKSHFKRQNLKSKPIPVLRGVPGIRPGTSSGLSFNLCGGLCRLAGFVPACRVMQAATVCHRLVSVLK